MRVQAFHRAIVVSLAALGTPGLALATCPEADQGQVYIYPTADLLPENLLRMYVYFPRPMGGREGLRSVRLLGDQGVPIEGTFLASREDLWSSDRRRLTLLFDPSRVKTGLAAHENMGRVLVAGRSYTLDISGGALDAARCPLGANTRFGFAVVDADYDPPDPARLGDCRTRGATAPNLWSSLSAVRMTTCRWLFDCGCSTSTVRSFPVKSSLVTARIPGSSRRALLGRRQPTPFP